MPYKKKKKKKTTHKVILEQRKKLKQANHEKAQRHAAINPFAVSTRLVADDRSKVWHALPIEQRQIQLRQALKNAGFHIKGITSSAYGEILKAAVAKGVLFPDGRPNPIFLTKKRDSK